LQNSPSRTALRRCSRFDVNPVYHAQIVQPRRWHQISAYLRKKFHVTSFRWNRQQEWLFCRLGLAHHPTSWETLILRTRGSGTWCETARIFFMQMSWCAVMTHPATGLVRWITKARRRACIMGVRSSRSVGPRKVIRCCLGAGQGDYELSRYGRVDPCARCRPRCAENCELLTRRLPLITLTRPNAPMLRGERARRGWCDPPSMRKKSTVT